MSKTYENYKIEGDSIKRAKKECERCGQATFMADHNNRWTCGRCGYSIMKKGKKK